MIVYKRDLTKEDFNNINEIELIVYKDNNIAYIVVLNGNSYIIRKKKIFNNQIMLEKTFKTKEQVIKVINN